MLSGKIEQYEDIKSILERAMEKQGAIFTTSSPGQAIRWRQRAYYYRKLLRKAQPGSLGLLDRMELRIDKASPTKVIIDFPYMTGTLTDLEGTPIERHEPSVEDALAAVRKLV